MNMSILIYGANGYTGRQLADYLISKGVYPILAGRSTKVRELAEKLQCEYRVFTTEDAGSHLSDIDILVNLAGPFIHTQIPLIESCLSTKTHYLDVSGEYADANRVYEYDSKAREAGIVLLPSVGIFSAPMDLVAYLASQQIDEPTQLQIGFASEGKPSKGSVSTALSKISSPGVQLRNGEYLETYPADRETEMTVCGKEISMVTHPWRADLLLARLSTGVNDIETFNGFPSFMTKMMKGKLKWLRFLMERVLIRYLPDGPTPEQQKSGRIYAKAVASNRSGETSHAELTGPDAYHFTAASITGLSDAVFHRPELCGFLTPAQVGTDWINNIDGLSVTVNEKTFFSGNKTEI